MQTATKMETATGQPEPSQVMDSPPQEANGSPSAPAQTDKRPPRPNRRAARYRDLNLPRYEDVPDDLASTARQEEIPRPFPQRQEEEIPRPSPQRQEEIPRPAPQRQEEIPRHAPQRQEIPLPVLVAAPAVQGTLASVWAQLNSELQSCGNKNNIKEDINDFAILATRIRDEKSSFVADIQDGSKTQASFDEAVHHFAESYANITGAAYEQMGRTGIIAKIERSVEAAIYERIQQCTYVKKYALQVTQAMRRDVVKSALDKLPWPQAREGLVAIPELYAADRLLAEMKTYERQFRSVVVKNEELFGFEIGIIALKAQIACGYAPNLADTLRQIVAQRVEAVLTRVDTALQSQPRTGAGDAAGLVELDRGAIEAVGAFILREFSDTGAVQSAILRTAQYAQQVFEDKKSQHGYAEVYRYHLVDDLWEGLYVAPPGVTEPHKKHPLSDVGEDWNNFLQRVGVCRDDLLVDLSTFDAAVLETLMPYSEATRGLMCGGALLGWMAVTALIFVLPRVLDLAAGEWWWIPLIPLVSGAAFMVMMWRSRKKRKLWFRLWTALLCVSLCLVLGAQGALYLLGF